MVLILLRGKLVKRGLKVRVFNILKNLFFKIKRSFSVLNGATFIEELFMRHRLLLGFAVKRFGARRLALAVPIKKRTGVSRALTIFLRALEKRAERSIEDRLFLEITDLFYNRGRTFSALGQYYESLEKNRPFVKTFKRLGVNKRRRSFFY